MMLRVACLTGGLIGLAMAFSACEWSSGGGETGFNTSRAGLNVNVSGNYRGALSGNLAVANTTGGPISSFVIQQSGNRIDVTDSNGQRYQGAVGAPGAIVAAGTSEIPAGAQLASYQLSWSGEDGFAGKTIDFTGVIEIVAVDNVRGDTTTQTISSNQASSDTRTTDSQRTNASSAGGTSTETTTTVTTSGDSRTEEDNQTTPPITITEVTGDGTTNVITILPGPTHETSSSTDRTADLTTTADSSRTADQTSTVSDQSTRSSSSERDTVREITTTFQLTEGNSQFRLRGTWIEQGGVSSPVNALSPGAGLFGVTATTGT